MGNLCEDVMRMHNGTNKLDEVRHGSVFIHEYETKQKHYHNIFLYIYFLVLLEDIHFEL